MPFTTGEDGEHTFRKEVFAEDGSTIQYKFRIGHSGWWVLDENVATGMTAPIVNVGFQKADRSGSNGRGGQPQQQAGGHQESVVRRTPEPPT